jgi:hypothetical protein
LLRTLACAVPLLKLVVRSVEDQWGYMSELSPPSVGARRVTRTKVQQAPCISACQSIT